jgi:hypothetical protein
MRTEENCAGADTVIVQPRDRLETVPVSHKYLVSPAITKVFEDPVAHFRDIAERTPFEEMRLYLQKLLARPKWVLNLHTNAFDSPGIAAFEFFSAAVHPVQIAPGNRQARCGGVSEMTGFYRQIGWLHWTVYGGADGLDTSPDESFAECEFHMDVPGIDSTATFSFGSTACGDWFIYDKSGRAGMLSHESLRVHWIGTVADTINWIFHELRHKRTPEFDYNRWGKGR